MRTPVSKQSADVQTVEASLISKPLSCKTRQCDNVSNLHANGSSRLNADATRQSSRKGSSARFTKRRSPCDDRLHVCFSQCLCDRTRAAVADNAVVDLDNG